MTDSTEDLTQESETDSDLTRRLRASIRARDSIISEKDSALTLVQKQSAFQAAGIDPDTGTGKLLFQTYDGQFDKDNVLKAAQEYGIAPTGVTPSEPPVEQASTNAGEVQVNAEIDAATGGGLAAGATPPDPDARARAAFDQVMQTTGNKEQASAAHFEAKLAAAMEGARK